VDAIAFKRAWEQGGDRLQMFPATAFSEVRVPEDARRFLEIAGLPPEAAPFLSFGPQTVNWIPTELWRANAGLGLAIGSDGHGNPIVLLEDGQIVFLDHDDVFAQRYVNKSVATLAESLLRYRSLIEQACTINGPDAFLEGSVPSLLNNDFTSFLEMVDPLALAPEAMWAIEISTPAGQSDPEA